MVNLFEKSDSTFLKVEHYFTGSPGYTQAWLKGEQTEVGAHPHEGLRLAGGEGWIAVGENIGDCPQFCARQVRIVRVDNDGNVVWTTLLGDTHQNANQLAHSSGFSVAQVMIIVDTYYSVKQYLLMYIGWEHSLCWKWTMAEESRPNEACRVSIGCCNRQFDMDKTCKLSRKTWRSARHHCRRTTTHLYWICQLS